ncbi:MAG: hypothetical protein HGA22_00220, partial [Clostridiales bacterium]|nr:hypothetical protein [Clostridiales bacterium]
MKITVKAASFFIYAFCGIIFTFLAISSLIYTSGIDPKRFRVEHIIYSADNAALNLLVLAAVLLFVVVLAGGMFIKRPFTGSQELLEKRNRPHEKGSSGDPAGFPADVKPDSSVRLAAAVKIAIAVMLLTTTAFGVYWVLAVQSVP